MKTNTIKCIAIAILTLAASAMESRAEWVTVKRVVDGDTFVTTDGTTVRIKGIDTPETKHPDKGVEAGGEQASSLARTTLEGKVVYLEGTAKDKYGRRVSEVRLPGGVSYGDVVRSTGLDKQSNPYLQTINTGTPVRPKRSSSAFGVHTPAAPRSSGSTHFAPSTYSGSGSGSTYVNGYFRGDGTYVAPHYRSSPGGKK
jgi:hypothetical protein